MSSWEDHSTAQYYEAFCRQHPRYQEANAALIDHAGIEPGMAVLDFAAGSGRTAEAALQRLGAGGRILCVEPAQAMRAAGMLRLADRRISWAGALPQTPQSFDRILCGAAIWQMESVPGTLCALAHLLKPGGALCFNIPATYLMEADEPGGGADPSLLGLLTCLSAGHARQACGRAVPAPVPPRPPLAAEALGGWLEEAGLQASAWSFRVRLTQQAFAAWLKIPLLTDHLFGDLPPVERARRIDAALALADHASWKWEHWRGWTAWRA